MKKGLRQLDAFLKKNKRSKQARDAVLRRIIPEYFVDQKLKQFEAYNLKERAYSDTVENYLEREREDRIDEINEALLKNIQTNLNLDNLSRIVRAGFAEDPLSSLGSVKRPPGGRFNIGTSTRVTSDYFQALYLANDYNTAFEESYHSEDESIGDFSHFKVSVQLDTYLDLRDRKVIKDFFKVIESIKLPKEFITLAYDLGVEPMGLCKSEKELYEAIFSERYKAWDTWVDKYSPSQWFGYYVYKIGIPAIIYPSVRHKEGYNLAIFLENVIDTNCTVRLEKPDEWRSINDDRKDINSDSCEKFLYSIIKYK